MPEITLMPVPRGRWVMMCPCGATETRAGNGPRWAEFDLERLAGKRYRVTCHACGHVTEHCASQATTGSTGTASC